MTRQTWRLRAAAAKRVQGACVATSRTCSPLRLVLLGFFVSLARITIWPLAAVLSSAASAQTHPLNDTGQTAGYNATTSTGSVSAGSPDPETAGFNEQDCSQGRAAADAVGVLYKLGGSTRLGADYTRIANNGSELPVNATLGSGANDWACTRDKRSGLIWEVKVNDAVHLRQQGHDYTWYDTNAAVNGGTAGTLGSNTSCNFTLSNCNTTAYRDAVNALPGGLCGASDWRLPSADELQSLLHYGLSSGTRIDATWFPNTPVAAYWSGQNYAPFASIAWVVNFNDGSLFTDNKSFNRQVRLVRGGQ